MGRNDLTTRGQITLTLDREVIEYIRNYSKETDIPISRLVDRLVRDWMERDKEKAPAEQW